MFTKQYTLTKRFNRYAGDENYELILLIDDKGVAHLYHQDGIIKTITSHPEYVQWLQNNHMDLLTMAYSNRNPPYEIWWNDRNQVYGRRKEFEQILKSFNN